MARQENDREDLLREAVALVERAELRVIGFDEPIVAGFRREGAVSYFFGSAPVLQFNTRHELRRAYWNRQVIKAENGTLVAMERVRTKTETRLKSRPLTSDETQDFREMARSLLTSLRQAIQQNKVQVVGQVPGDCDVLGRIAAWLSIHAHDLVIADRPNVR